MELATQPPGRPIARVESYEDLLAACRAQVQALGINYQILDSLAGFADGYSTKLLAHSEYASSGGRRTKRHFSPQSFDAYLTALGFDLVVVENPEKIERLKHWMDHKLLKRGGPQGAVGNEAPIVTKFSRKFMRQIARLGGRARAAKLRALASRRAQARQAALTRWHPPEPTRGF